MILECMLTGLRDGTVGVYRVEDTYVEGPRSLYIQRLPSGNALIATQTSSLGCTYKEAVEGTLSTDVLQTCLDGELTPDTVDTCLFGFGTGCVFVGDMPCE